MRIKVLTILLLWLTIGLSVTFAVQNSVTRIILISIAVGVTVHIVLIRKRKAEPTRE